jgi:polysaccharide export outer membrane protein
MRNKSQLTSTGIVGAGLQTGVFVVLACLGLASQANSQIPSSEIPTSSTSSVITSSASTSEKDERYRIGPGDVLEVLIYNQPQLSRPAVRVDGRGMIRLPLLEGEIRAACKTESLLASELTNRYQEYQKYPQVDVFIKEFNSQPVAVLGAVRAPGRFQLQRRIRLLELLTYSGGAAQNAGRMIQIVHGAGAPQLCDSENGAPTGETDEGLASYSLGETLRGLDAANPYVSPGDIVYVPDAEQIYVVGNVPKPSAIPLQEPLTVSRAIFMAGGVLPNSVQTNIHIRRKASGSLTKTELVVDLQKINKGTAEDLVLQANDVVEVPKEGGAKSFFRGIMTAIVPMAVSLPTRIIY